MEESKSEATEVTAAFDYDIIGLIGICEKYSSSITLLDSSEARRKFCQLLIIAQEICSRFRYIQN